MNWLNNDKVKAVTDLKNQVADTVSSVASEVSAKAGKIVSRFSGPQWSEEREDLLKRIEKLERSQKCLHRRVSAFTSNPIWLLAFLWGALLLVLLLL